MIRVLLADDHALVRGGVRAILEAQEDISVVAEADDGVAAVEAAIRAHPHVVVMDVRMPRIDGLEATRRLRARGVPSAVLVATSFGDDEVVFEALRAGASGFVLKSTPPDRLVDAVRTVAAGEALLSPDVTRRLIEHFVRRPEPDAEQREKLASLTEREAEVLIELARGRSNAEIGAALHLSEATVKTHVTRVLSKLDVRSRVQAVVLAFEVGLVRPGER